jgi:transcriptional regulator with XRE-family HTH domain
VDIGEKIKRLRVKYGLTQQELANRTELSKGYISQLERNLTSPSIATLRDLLESLGTNLKDFFSDDAPEKVIFPRQDAYETPDEEAGHVVKWLVPNAQKNVMEPILVSIAPGGESARDDPHEGEEFGYVLSGSVLLHLGEEKMRARRGDSFYFKPTMPHYLENTGKVEAVVLWVSSPPWF